MHAQRKHPGIELRRSRSGQVSYRAEAFDSRAERRVYKTFPTLAAAKAWRQDMQVAIRSGKFTGARTPTLAEAADALIEGMRNGTIRNRKGEPYKPSVARSYRRAFDKRLLPEFGNRPISDLRRRDVQALIDKLAADGLDGSTIRNTLDPLRVIYRWALTREQVSMSPTTNLEVPAPEGKRERIASPVEAAALIAALPVEQRGLWATAMYAGLRRGELRGLRWGDVDLASGVIRVERGWDAKEGEIAGKTRAARRTVPITAVLRDFLTEHRMSGESDADALVFGTTDLDPFDPATVRRRAWRAWKAAGLEPIGFHESRHTFASIGIAAGVNAKALSTYMGHASVTITYDRYGHLMPGNESEATGLLDAYLLRAGEGQSRGSDAPTTADRGGPERNGGEVATWLPVRDSAT